MPDTKATNQYDIPLYTPGDVIRIKHYDTKPNAYRVWKIVAVHLGSTSQEGTYELKPLDISGNEPIQIPCILLEKHPLVERC